MADETIWKGTSSQWKNCGPYFALAVSVPVSVLAHWQFGAWAGQPIFFVYLPVLAAALWSLWRWLVLKTTAYHLTTERLLTTTGILTKVTDTLELYRVRDMKTVQTLAQRMVGLQDICLCTADASTAEVRIDFVPVALNLSEQVRKAVETCRMKKNVRVMDVAEEHPGHDAPTE
jgi:uncharacterized membrane protein YdbT with pleckstrin-like domain